MISSATREILEDIASLGACDLSVVVDHVVNYNLANRAAALLVDDGAGTLPPAKGPPIWKLYAWRERMKRDGFPDPIHADGGTIDFPELVLDSEGIHR